MRHGLTTLSANSAQSLVKYLETLRNPELDDVTCKDLEHILDNACLIAKTGFDTTEHGRPKGQHNGISKRSQQ